MTAPDRIWISADELGRKVDTFLCSSDSYYADNLGEVEYVRKGAFPVEDLVALIEEWEEMQLGPNGYYSMPLYGIREQTVPLLCRILSLLEDSE